MGDRSKTFDRSRSSSSRVGDGLRLVTRLWDPVQLSLWIGTYRGQRGLRAFAVNQFAIFMLTARRLRDDEITRRAAGLTYYTLLALVPLLAVGFALFKAFGGLRAIERPLRDFIVSNLAFGNERQISQWLERFVENVNAGAIAGVGVLILIYSAVGLLTNVEKAFNRIWGIKRLRPFAIRFAIYWCMVTLTPPLLGVSLSISAQARSSSLALAVSQWLPFGLGKWLLAVTADLAVSLAFVIVFVIVPNVRVRLRAALLGGLVAGLLWTAGKAAFIALTAGSAKYSAVYGALSALPLLILWLYYSWLITLFGVTYTYANQTVQSRSLQIEGPVLNQRARERLAARLMIEVVRDYIRGVAAPTSEGLADRVRAAYALVQRMLERLVEASLLCEVGGKGQHGYLPARDPSTISLADLRQYLQTGRGATLELPSDATTDRLASLLDDAESATRETLSRVSFRSLAIAEVEQENVTAGGGSVT